MKLWQYGAVALSIVSSVAIGIMWGAMFKSNAELVRVSVVVSHAFGLSESNKCCEQYLKDAKIIRSQAVEKAFLAVDRANYVKDRDEAYIDAPILTGKDYHLLSLLVRMNSHSLQDMGKPSALLTCMAMLLNTSKIACILGPKYWMWEAGRATFPR